ncbi:glycosyltransferase family 2 protein [uncultured Clostridium sp.]|jgi:glycosyltransferase involved in cell wall biosynthesis|uniref:glycosyltransferase family 2 protein n=1 Tax=uncultured Clostridium sp. TaxID=59620 RepID=UPI0026707825|nr:glycosyltransferase family 2 protein [uncultured Clostridium sp.]
MNITVCTPTFNRANLLEKLYGSLKKQNFKSFEWLIVDDGSSDNTEEVVNNFIKESLINIRYIKKKNGGKHTALNIGIDKAQGKLFWIVDSDDYIVEGALKYIWDKWNEIENKNEFAGLSGLRGYTDGSIIGTKGDNEYIDTDSLSYRYKYRILGDKAEVYRTDLLRKFKFPEFKEERYVTEAVVWNRIANENLKLRFLNEVTYICEYLEGGLTNTSDKNIMESWKGTTLYYKELLSYRKVALKDKILNGARAYLHYCYEKGIGFKGILNITKNPIYIILSWFVYSAKLSKRIIRRGYEI